MPNKGSRMLGIRRKSHSLGAAESLGPGRQGGRDDVLCGQRPKLDNREEERQTEVGANGQG